MLCDALGNPVKFTITVGQVHDVTQGEILLEGETAKYVLADKGYIKPALFERIQAMQAEAVIPNRSNTLEPRKYDKAIYKERKLVERLFAKMKHFRRVATRYDKKIQCYAGFVSLACIMILLR